MQMTELKDIAGGALMENATAAIEQVIRNMVDLNTPYKDKRAVTIKLAPVKPLKTAFNFGKDLTTGEIFVEEYGSQIRGQMSINDIQTKEESSNETDNTVIDYREAKKA